RGFRVVHPGSARPRGAGRRVAPPGAPRRLRHARPTPAGRPVQTDLTVRPPPVPFRVGSAIAHPHRDSPRDTGRRPGMGLFRKRKSRATRRAEARAIKARAKLEAKLAAKNERRRIKGAERAGDKALKAQLRAQQDSDKAALKAAEAQLKAVRE